MQSFRGEGGPKDDRDGVGVSEYFMIHSVPEERHGFYSACILQQSGLIFSFEVFLVYLIKSISVVWKSVLLSFCLS